MSSSINGTGIPTSKGCGGDDVQGQVGCQEQRLTNSTHCGDVPFGYWYGVRTGKSRMPITDNVKGAKFIIAARLPELFSGFFQLALT